MQRDALRALIAHRGGSVTSTEAAQALGVEEPVADGLLTALSRESATTVRLEVDDDGTFRYDFRGDEQRFRVLEEQEPPLDAPNAPGTRSSRA